MEHFLRVHDKTDCTKCRYSCRIPLSSQMTCKHPLAQVQRNVEAGTHGQPYWPVSFDPKFFKSCPRHGLREIAA